MTVPVQNHRAGVHSAPVHVTSVITRSVTASRGGVEHLEVTRGVAEVPEPFFEHSENAFAHRVRAVLEHLDLEPQAAQRAAAFPTIGPGRFPMGCPRGCNPSPSDSDSASGSGSRLGPQ